MKNNNLHIYTDGSSYPKIHLGAWAFIVADENQVIISNNSGLVLEYATNNRMELQAMVEALEGVIACQKITIYSDSEFALRVINGKKMANKNPLDEDLLERLGKSKNKFKEIAFVKVKAHSKDFLNTTVDKLARKTLRASQIDHQQVKKEKIFLKII